MMSLLRRIERTLCAGALLLSSSGAFAGTPPAQKLPSALLVFPLIDVSGGRDTRVELLNLSADSQVLQCFYVDGASCDEVGFVVFLTAFQPLAWLAGSGLSDPQAGSAVPPFFGSGELKCAVVPSLPQIEFYNTVQGRATTFGTDGQTVSYGAVAFQRLTDGAFSGTLALDGVTYAQCPDKLHFDVLEDQPGSVSEMVLIPCTENLLTQTPTFVTAQFIVINEFEQPFSTSIGVKCFDRRPLGEITGALERATGGSDTAHVVVRGVGGPLLGLVIDQVPFGSSTGMAGNEPSFQGGRSATVIFP